MRDIYIIRNRRYSLGKLVAGLHLKLTPNPEVHKEVRRLIIQAPANPQFQMIIPSIVRTLRQESKYYRASPKKSIKLKTND